MGGLVWFDKIFLACQWRTSFIAYERCWVIFEYSHVFRSGGSLMLLSRVYTSDDTGWQRQLWSVVAEWLGRRTLNQRVVGWNSGEGTARYLWAGYLKIHSSGIARISRIACGTARTPNLRKKEKKNYWQSPSDADVSHWGGLHCDITLMHVDVKKYFR
jgi:hypothetical protein